MDQFEQENIPWSRKSRPSKGPARLCRFCLFSITLPITLLVSTMWCEAQTIKMNSTFRAYLLPERPQLRATKNRVQMERKIRDLEDDMKEYWGFYLLKDSFYKVSVCSRHEGASVVVIKHSRNVARCAWLGELDSAEESDEMSNEFDFKSEVLDVDLEDEGHQVSVEMDASSEEAAAKEVAMMAAHSKELTNTVGNIQKWSPRSRKKLVKHLLEQMLEDRAEDEPHMETIRRQFGLVNSVSHSGTQEPKVTVRGLAADYDGGEEDTAAEEVFGDYGPVDHLFNRGTFNQKNHGDKKDMSNEETRSSWSSSEEALAACEGAMANIALEGGTRCHENATFADMMPFMTNLTHQVDSTGFYYFIFTNDNEITDNFVAASFDLRKTVFDVSRSSQECNSTECSIPLAFMSEEHLVLEVPRQESENCEYEAEGVTNYHQCNTVVTAESICEPRGPVYGFFLLLVPVFIVLFAYI